jgi:16S rRNA (adenine1518-N6/adenine1519-N6)-dimethyltransferase
MSSQNEVFPASFLILTQKFFALPFVSPKKYLGQNFLRDENIARKIVDAVAPTKNDVLIEIGPGHGVLTKYFFDNVQHLLAYEIDERVINELREKFPASEIIYQDFLESDLRKISQQYSSSLRVVGNIPYNITSQILFKLFDSANGNTFIRDATLMLQLDVAKRLVSKPKTKEYGILSVFTQHYADVELLFSVSPNCFFPKPKVTSAIVQLRFKKSKSNVLDENIFRTTVRTAFGKRRKILRNALKYFPTDETLISDYLLHTTFKLDVRPEELTINDFIALSNDITNFLSTHHRISLS